MDTSNISNSETFNSDFFNSTNTNTNTNSTANPFDSSENINNAPHTHRTPAIMGFSSRNLDEKGGVGVRDGRTPVIMPGKKAKAQAAAMSMKTNRARTTTRTSTIPQQTNSNHLMYFNSGGNIDNDDDDDNSSSHSSSNSSFASISLSSSKNTKKSNQSNGNRTTQTNRSSTTNTTKGMGKSFILLFVGLAVIVGSAFGIYVAVEGGRNAIASSTSATSTSTPTTSTQGDILNSTFADNVTDTVIDGEDTINPVGVTQAPSILNIPVSEIDDDTEDERTNQEEDGNALGDDDDGFEGNDDELDAADDYYYVDDDDTDTDANDDADDVEYTPSNDDEMSAPQDDEYYEDDDDGSADDYNYTPQDNNGGEDDYYYDYNQNDDGKDTSSSTCVDDSDFVFENGRQVAVSCEWLTHERKGIARKRKWCPSVQDRCPRSCNACAAADDDNDDDGMDDNQNDDNSTTTCVDESNYIFKNGRDVMVTCNWLNHAAKGMKRKARWCPIVQYHCPQACDACGKECADDEDFTFPLRQHGKTDVCSWIVRTTVESRLQQRRDRYCLDFDLADPAMQEACPSSCGFCAGANADPSNIWPKDEDTSSCANNADFVFENDYDKLVDCAWIDYNPKKVDARRKKWCTKSFIKSQCLSSCQSC